MSKATSHGTTKSPLTVARLLDAAEETHASAASLLERKAMLSHRSEKHFVQAIDGFTEALRHLPQSEVALITSEQQKQLHDLVERIVEDVDRFVASNENGDLARLKRHQHLVARVYELRQAFEAIVRGVTPDPAMMDVRWEEEIERAIRGGPN